MRLATLTILLDGRPIQQRGLVQMHSRWHRLKDGMRGSDMPILNGAVINPKFTRIIHRGEEDAPLVQTLGRVAMWRGNHLIDNLEALKLLVQL